MEKGLGITRWDLALMAGILLIAGTWWLTGRESRQEASTVRVYAGSRLFSEVSADRDARLEIPGPRGASVVEIRSGKVRMLFSPCPDQLCTRMGRIGAPGGTILCIPNRVSVTVISKHHQPDAVTY
ncbi:MAG TPA: NusG domain II-containing protein [Deltaproteobacteria bacterium]|nr:NusG domain II-containing protein [Deltaproteobacteria bacterium]